MKRFNEYIITKIIAAVSTVWCAYFFAFLALLGFPYGSTSIPQYISWTSQTFIQLTMLSVIMAGQNMHHKKRDEHEKKVEKHLGL